MHLLVQLASAALLVLLTTLIHGAGVTAIAHWLGLDVERAKVPRLHPRTIATLSAVALLLFVLHALEIALFGFFFFAVGALPGLEESLYFSAASYSTIGTPEFAMAEEWRLVGAVEGVAGFLMLGWSAAFFVTDMNKLLRA